MTLKDISKQFTTAVQTVPNLVQILRDGLQQAETGDNVVVTQTLQSGTEIGSIKVGDDAAVKFYAPAQSIDYSTTEKKIGKSIDGKDLYQKSFTATLNNIAQNTAENVASVSDLNIDQIVDISGNVNYYNGETWYYSTLGLYFGAYVYTNGYLQFIQTVTQQTTNRSYKIVITIQYTKTA